MITIMLIISLLMPPGITEIKHDDNRIEYKVPNGYGINGIRVISTNGNHEDARKEADALLEILMNNEYEYTIMYEGAEVHIKAHTRLEAVNKMKRWYKVIGQCK